MTRLLGAVGTIVMDTIARPGAAVVEQPGGAMYSLSALSAARPADCSVLPILQLGADVAPAVMPMLARLPGLDLDAVRVAPDANPRVHLRYVDDERREETLSGALFPAPTDLLEQADRCHALYVNFISGREMDLATAEALRRRFDGFVYADLHSLFLADPADGPRAPRALAELDRWTACFDTIQVNADELALMGVEPSEIPRVVESGPRLVFATLGGEGALVAQRMPDGSITSERVPVAGGSIAGDPTGCGDVWGATCFAALVGGADPTDAARRAHRAASVRLRGGPIDKLARALASSDASRSVLP